MLTKRYKKTPGKTGSLIAIIIVARPSNTDEGPQITPQTVSLTKSTIFLDNGAKNKSCDCVALLPIHQSGFHERTRFDDI